MYIIWQIRSKYVGLNMHELSNKRMVEIKKLIYQYHDKLDELWKEYNRIQSNCSHTYETIDSSGFGCGYYSQKCTKCGAYDIV